MASDVRAIQEKIDKLDKEVQELERRKAQLEGKLDSLKEQLKKDFKVDSVEAAENQIKVINDKVTGLKQEEAEIAKELDVILAGDAAE